MCKKENIDIISDREDLKKETYDLISDIKVDTLQKRS